MKNQKNRKLSKTFGYDGSPCALERCGAGAVLVVRVVCKAAQAHEAETLIPLQARPDNLLLI
eukprot:5670077-Amphidinium_carterae.1